MAERDSVDISDMPAISRLVDDATTLDRPIALRRGSKVVATITPVTAEPSGQLTSEQIEALRSAAGAWSDFDADAFLEQVRTDRDNSDRLPVDL